LRPPNLTRAGSWKKTSLQSSLDMLAHRKHDDRPNQLQHRSEVPAGTLTGTAWQSYGRARGAQVKFGHARDGIEGPPREERSNYPNVQFVVLLQPSLPDVLLRPDAVSSKILEVSVVLDE
jgi:hypothetical protein